MAGTAVEDSRDNALLAIIRSARIKGQSYLDIERMYQIPAPRAEAMMKAYYAEKSTAIDPNEQRLLQLDRLESLIDVLYSMASMGNVKSAEALLKTLEQINELLGLNLQTTKTEIRIITEEQSEVVYRIVQGIVKGLLSSVVTPLVTDQKQLAVIEDQWDDKVAELYGKVTEEIIEAELVE